MNYGVPLKDKIKLNHKILEMAGYRLIPNHVDGFKVDEQWISNAQGFHAHFPRFHLIKDGKKWYIHYDYFKAGYDEHKTKTNKCPENLEEIKRLIKIREAYETKNGYRKR